MVLLRYSPLHFLPTQVYSIHSSHGDGTNASVEDSAADGFAGTISHIWKHCTNDLSKDFHA